MNEKQESKKQENEEPNNKEQEFEHKRKYWESLRNAIVHEDNLVNHRLTWTLTIEGFLVTGFFLVQNAVLSGNLTLVKICVIEILLAVIFSGALWICYISGSMITAAFRQIGFIRSAWLNKYAEERRNLQPLPRWFWGDGALPEYDLCLMSVATVDGLANKGHNLVIVALVGTNLHIRIFDANRKRVVDNELMSEETLTTLKEKQLNPLEEQKQQIIQDATSIAGHTPLPEYDLCLMSVATVDGLANKGHNLVIVALVGTNLHIRIFDANRKRVVDKAEDELMSGKTLIPFLCRFQIFRTFNRLLHKHFYNIIQCRNGITTLKKQLNLLLEEQKQQIIRDATSIAGHTKKGSPEFPPIVGEFNYSFMANSQRIPFILFWLNCVAIAACVVIIFVAVPSEKPDSGSKVKVTFEMDRLPQELTNELKSVLESPQVKQP